MTPPQSIAHYRLGAMLGEGGMGSVYRATDTKLGREVAIKILPDAFAGDDDRLARFTREAQVLASLNHPNIAMIHGVEERALVMELVEGPTLAERIEQGPLPSEEAVLIARQIAEALEYAHEHGVIHRDLKPANIKITPEGRVKVLDFGLAKAMSQEPSSANPGASPTLTMRATVAGVILGTAAYMSPEQARGQAVDRRADIWAFGVVLHEMLTGRQLFGGPTISDTLAAVLKTAFDLSAIPAGLRPVVERCLRRDIRSRWQAIGDVRVALEEGPATPAAPPVRRSTLPWVVAAATTAAALVAGMLLWRAMQPQHRSLIRLSADLGPDSLTGIGLTAAISHDGTRIAFLVKSSGATMLATRLLDQPKPQVLAGTEGASDPFFSPNGEWIAFFASGKLKKVGTQGGAPITLASDIVARGASWGEDGSIVAGLSTAGSLSILPEGGGTVRPLTNAVEFGDATHRWPQLLPGAQAVVFTAHKGFDFENADIATLNRSTGEVKRVVRGGYYGRYLASGHLVYVHEGTLFAVPFDARRLEVRGAPVAVLDDIASNSGFGSAQFDSSRTGTSVYLAGKGGQARPLVWLDAAGKMEPMIAALGLYLTPRISPDGKRVAMGGVTGATADLSIYDVQRDTMQRLTFTGAGNTFPVWTPDGKHLVFGSQGTGFTVWWARADGAGEAQRLFESKNIIRPHSFSPDGRRLAYHELAPGTSGDILTVPLDLTDPEHPKAGQPEVFLRTQSIERYPAFSPDGRWIAYSSSESGADEVFVRPFPLAGGRWQISNGGGQFPIWARNGRELFFENLENRIMVADYTVRDGSFDFQKPRVWSSQPILSTTLFPNLDLSPDGKRFLVMPGETVDRSSVHVTFLLNFFDELRRKVPAK